MIRYRKLGYVELNVTNLAHSREFYEQIVGLQWVGTREDDAELFRCDQDPYSVALHQHEMAGFRCAGWMLADMIQFDMLHQRLRERGVPYEELSASECEVKQVKRATRMVEPNSQATMEFYLPSRPANDFTFAMSHTHIQRLGHVVFSTPRNKEANAFFRDVLNFNESDSIGEMANFLRPNGSPYHHGLGIGFSPRPQFHHLNFMVDEIDDIGIAMSRHGRHQVPIVYGPGRHPASGSVFLYFLDPDSITLEYSFGMEEFAEIDARSARVLPPVPESIDSWGAARDPRMGASGEMHVATIRRSTD